MARGAGEALTWFAGAVWVLLGDSLSNDRKGRQARRKQERSKKAEEKDERAE